MADSVEAWIRKLANPDRQMAAAAALVEIGGPAVEPLVNALADADDSVRIYAIETLGQIGDARAVEPLIHALGGAEWYFAAEALGRIGDARAVEPLVNALEDSRSEVRKNAASALTRLGNRVSLPRKILLSDTMTPQARFTALEALSRNGQYYSLGLLRRYRTLDAQLYCERMADDNNPEVRAAADEILRLREHHDTLLRPGQREPGGSEELLRPAAGRPSAETGDDLLRAAETRVLPQHATAPSEP